MQHNIDNKTKVTFSQQTLFFWGGCRSGAWARVVAAGPTLTTFTRDAAVSFAETKPYHYPNHSHLCAPCQDETRCASHTNKALIARCRASERPRSPPSCFFARVVEIQDDAQNHNLKPLSSAALNWQLGHIVHTSSKIISTVLTGRGPRTTPSLQPWVHLCQNSCCEAKGGVRE